MTIYGIDLGTTYCAVARVEEGGDADPVAVAFPGSGHAFPSLVLLEPAADGRPQATVGGAARRRFLSRCRGLADPPEGVHLIRGAKNYIGTRAPVDRGPPWCVGPREFYSSDVSALILRALKQRVDAQGLPPMRDVVITHPQKFNNRQRLATQQAGELAGLNVVGMITEPDAAAWAFERRAPRSAARRVLVFDFGGGTLDVVVMERLPGGAGARVLASFGKECGGLRVDQLVRERLAERYVEQNRAVLGEEFEPDEEFNAWTLEEFTFLAERLKCELNDENSAQDPDWPTQARAFTVQYAEANASRRFPPASLRVTLGEYARWIQGVLDDAMSVVGRALAIANLAEADIDEVRMTGQSSQLVPMRKRLEQRFRSVVIETSPDSYLHPATIVAAGAALFGRARRAAGDGGGLLVRGAVPESFSFASGGGGAGRRYFDTIRRGQPTPASFRETFKLTNEPLPDGGRVLPFEVFEGELREPIGRFELEFSRPLVPGDLVVVHKELADNGRFTLAAERDGERREARLTNAEGVYGADELARRRAELLAVDLQSGE
ncbi:MAG: Hsp70 family protein [Polyangiales bacterium]